MKIPMIGLGTYSLLGRDCVKVIKEALEIGYRHFDTASAYDNHKAIGQAIKGFERSHLFITSKITLEQINDQKIDQSVRVACEKALNELQTDYLDLYLIHWPDRSRPLEIILYTMHQLVKERKVRHVGVSNFTIHHIQDALDASLKVEANQVEFHPYLYQEKLLDFCKSQKIQLISYRPLGKGKLLEEESLFEKLGEKYQKTAPQVILRWIIQKDVAVIPKASSKKHLKENFSIFDFELSDEDMRSIDRLNRGKRYCVAEGAEFDY